MSLPKQDNLISLKEELKNIYKKMETENEEDELINVVKPLGSNLVSQELTLDDKIDDRDYLQICKILKESLVDLNEKSYETSIPLGQKIADSETTFCKSILIIYFVTT